MDQVSSENQHLLLFLYKLASEILCPLHMQFPTLLLTVFFFSEFLYEHTLGNLAIMKTTWISIRVLPQYFFDRHNADARIMSSSLAVSSPIEIPRINTNCSFNWNNYFLPCKNSEIIFAVFSAPSPLKFFEKLFNES